jgi:hypothetical protein
MTALTDSATALLKRRSGFAASQRAFGTSNAALQRSKGVSRPDEFSLKARRRFAVLWRASGKAQSSFVVPEGPHGFTAPLLSTTMELYRTAKLRW